MKRRHFLQSTAAFTAVAGTAVFSQNTASAASPIVSLEQEPLPYELNALEPFLSEEQMRYHYGKHHAAYYKNLHSLIEGTADAKKTLQQLVLDSQGAVFNNAAQAWNHTFFWNCMSPGTGGKPGEKLAKAIDRDFGDFTKFSELFQKAAASLFGSGWTWVVLGENGKLEILQSSNAENPLRLGKKPILVIDVWEHAYYVDYRNERAKFIAAFMQKINWPFLEEQLS